MRLFVISLLLCTFAGLAACGGGSSDPVPGSLSGNWEITLQRHAHPEPFVFSGFLLQSGPSITGGVILGGGCDGVGSVAGSLDGQNLSLTIDEFGQDISLTATMPPGGPSESTFLGGAFSSLAGACADYDSTGTWSAVRVTAPSGTFHGTLTGISAGGTDMFDVTGTLAQGPNTGSSNAMLNGSITSTGAPHFCPYLTSATLTGLISGTSVKLSLVDSTGAQIAQFTPASITPDGTSLTCQAGATSCYVFQPLSNACPGETGTVQLSFP